MQIVREPGLHRLDVTWGQDGFMGGRSDSVDDVRDRLVGDLRAASSDRASASRAPRARPVRPRRVDRRGRRSRRRRASRSTTAEVQACVRLARAPRPAVHRRAVPAPVSPAAPCPLGGPVVIVTTKMNRILSSRPRRTGGVGRAGRDQPRPHPRRSRRSACTSRPIRRASRRARSAATWPTTPADRTASRTASRRRTSSPSRSCCPTARSPCSVASTRSRPATTCAARSSAARARSASPRRIAVRLTPDPPARAHDARSTSTSVDDAAACVSAIIAAGIVPAALEMMTGAHDRSGRGRSCTPGYPIDAAAVLLVEVDGLPAVVDDAVELVARRSASARRAYGARSRPTRPSGSCCGRGASRRSAPSLASRPTTTCTTPSCRAPRLVEVLREVEEIADRHDLLVLNVFHAGDGNLHPLLVVRRARARRARAGARRRARRSSMASLAAGGVLSGEHGIGIEKRDFMPQHVLGRTTSTRRRASARRSTPTAWPTRARSCRRDRAAASWPARARRALGVSVLERVRRRSRWRRRRIGRGRRWTDAVGRRRRGRRRPPARCTRPPVSSSTSRRR